MNKQQPKQRFRYRAVSVHPTIMGACQAAHSLKDQRFLATEAPHLPLPDCSNPAGCRCKYQHWNDRRQEDRRSPFPGMADQYHSGDDRRSNTDRRRS